MSAPVSALTGRGWRQQMVDQYRIMRLFSGQFFDYRPNRANSLIDRVLVGSLLLAGLVCSLPVQAAEPAFDDTEHSSSEPIESEARERLQQVLAVACEVPAPTMSAFAEHLQVRASKIDPPPARGGTEVRRWMLRYDNGANLRLDFIYRQRSLQQLVLRYGRSVDDGLEIASPMIEIMTDEQCVVQRGREIVYQNSKPVFLTGLDAALNRSEIRDPFNPAVPEAALDDHQDRTDIDAATAVAVVDSGVDYRSQNLQSRLLRKPDGSLVGYDYWDDDAFAFDSNPSRSPFYPQRHGTRIASIIAEESEVAGLAVWRYPRSDPSRFGELVDDIAANGIRIVNLSMGSKKIQQWRSFELALERHQDILFVVSAGNNGVDLQQQPIYPAVFEHRNLLTVTSADDSGKLAQGSNWGVEAVDIMVPAEQLLTTGFADQLQQVSGSSYAAARISALASCLLAAKPGSTSEQLKESIIALAVPEARDTAVTRHGLVAQALTLKRGGCEPPSDEIVEVSRQRWTPLPAPSIAARSEGGSGVSRGEESFSIELTAVVLKKSGWQVQQVKDSIERAFTLLEQCRLIPASVEIVELEVPRMTRLLSEQSMQAVSSFVERDRVRLFFVEDTLRETEFGAEANGRVNARPRPRLRDTVWMTRWVPDVAVSLAHELYHVLADSGLHKKDPTNLMAEFTHGDEKQNAYTLTDSQCGQLRNMALGNGLIERL